MFPLLMLASSSPASPHGSRGPRHRRGTQMTAEPFGTLPDGHETRLYTLENTHLRVRITDFGGRMVSIEAPDRNGPRDPVMLGFDTVAGYLAAGSFGTLLGRYANRIAGATITLDGQTHTLSKNEGNNTLHGGAVAFSKLVWNVATADSATLV